VKAIYFGLSGCIRKMGFWGRRAAGGNEFTNREKQNPVIDRQVSASHGSKGLEDTRRYYKLKSPKAERSTKARRK
jgi:hypothetical protein